MDIFNKIKTSIRTIVQIGFTAIINGYVVGYMKGKIYSGSTKQVSVPSPNYCYSCLGAIGSCPIGSGSRNFKFYFYVIGFLTVVGALIGRVVCGWLCPFGLVQDLLYKIK